MQCDLCKRKVVDKSGLCKYHSSAKDALYRGYVYWRDAYSVLSWKDYLNKVKALEETGAWVKDVIAMEELRT